MIRDSPGPSCYSLRNIANMRCDVHSKTYALTRHCGIPIIVNYDLRSKEDANVDFNLINNLRMEGKLRPREAKGNFA